MKIRYRVGVDEAGRGPLAGPVAVGVVMVPETFNMRLLKGVKDSKQLTPKKRDELYKYLSKLPGLSWSVVMVSASIIDKKGIMEAVRRAMQKALAKLDPRPMETLVLLDGSLYAPASFTYQKTIIRGDQTEPLISAASILAKVTRDRYMVRAHTRYPVYGFDVHKGYGTAMHRERIQKQGLSPLHRKTFCRKIT